ncbi:Glycoside hydrolase family 81 protein [Mycena venus]|uniref:Glycoside hydrolase family 81 protein n=1 Tax=Mycena venus TaxID=2733690 RepID=A0A8H6XYG9_9AGAR|nr:Glycoside hydrolase family 81 protein [Mycena venus]
MYTNPPTFCPNMRFTIFASALFAAVGLVHAADDRLLFTIPAGDSMDKFTADFTDACTNWQPALDQGLTFVEALVEPGDFSGKNADTEAKIVCSFTDGTTIETFTNDVAASLGATPA